MIIYHHIRTYIPFSLFVCECFAIQKHCHHTDCSAAEEKALRKQMARLSITIKNTEFLAHAPLPTTRTRWLEPQPHSHPSLILTPPHPCVDRVCAACLRDWPRSERKYKAPQTRCSRTRTHTLTSSMFTHTSICCIHACVKRKSFLYKEKLYSYFYFSI